MFYISYTIPAPFLLPTCTMVGVSSNQRDVSRLYSPRLHLTRTHDGHSTRKFISFLLLVLTKFYCVYILPAMYEIRHSIECTGIYRMHCIDFFHEPVFYDHLVITSKTHGPFAHYKRIRLYIYLFQYYVIPY